MNRKRAILLIAVLLLATAGGLAVRAQESGDVTFFDTVDVHVVNVEVVVTGPDGVPVRGLTSDDFELLEDGKPVEISNFYSVDRMAPSPDPAQALAESSQRVQPREQELHLAVFVDGLSIEPVNRRLVLERLREYFNYQMERPTSLVLASFDGTLEVDSMPRYDADLLEEKFEILDKSSTRGAQRQMERLSLINDLDRADLGLGGGDGDARAPDVGPFEAQRTLTAIQLYAQREYDQSVVSMKALESFVEALAGLPGRKALLYVSGGMARNPGEALFYAWENKYIGYARQLGVNPTRLARELDTTPHLVELIKHANANRVTFYTIGAGRGSLPGGTSAEEGGIDGGSAFTLGGGRNWSVAFSSIDNANLGATLQELAAATGGLSMTRSRNFQKLLTQMSDDLGSYYSLGYLRDRERRSRSHRLRVRVKGRELSVRHRENYQEQTREEIMNGRTRSAVLLGSEENPLEVAMDFGEVKRAEKKGRLLVPIMVKVPLGKLVLVPQEEIHVGRIGIFICARDSEGRMSPVQSVEVPIRIPNDQLLTALGQVAGYRMTLLMRPEEHAVAVGVRDELGRVESTVINSYDPTSLSG